MPPRAGLTDDHPLHSLPASTFCSFDRFLLARFCILNVVTSPTYTQLPGNLNPGLCRSSTLYFIEKVRTGHSLVCGGF